MAGAVAISPSRRVEELGAEHIVQPSLVLFAGPPAAADEKPPHRWMVERPQDVGGALDIEGSGQVPTGIQLLDDGALNGEQLRLDVIPQGSDLRISGCSVANRLHEQPGSRLDTPSLRGDEAELVHRVGLSDHSAVPLSLENGNGRFVAPEASIPERANERCPGLEVDVDRLESDPGFFRYRGHRRSGVSPLLEEAVRGVEDRLTRGGGLGAPMGRVVTAALGYRIFRPVNEERAVMLDIDFPSGAAARAFLDILRNQVWPSRQKAPAKLGEPTTHILEMVDSHQY